MLVFSDVQSLCISARLWLQVGSPKRLRSDLNQTVSFPPTLFSSSTLRVYLFGIPFAFLAEINVSSLALLFLGPPIAEEILKPVGLYFLMYRWPHVVRAQLGMAGLG